MGKRLITKDKVELLFQKGVKTIVVNPDELLAPLAKDFALSKQLKIEYGNRADICQNSSIEDVDSVDVFVRAQLKKEFSITDECELDRLVNKVKEQVDKQKSENFTKTIDRSGVALIETSTVKPEKFDTGKEGDNVSLIDVLTLEESPRIGTGVMEMKNSCFDWTLKYDEIDYIIDGTLEIIIDDRKVVGHKGDTIFIPKNTSIQFATPDFARFLYVVYPANWSEQ